MTRGAARVVALGVAHWQVMRSYRLQTLLSFTGLVAGVVPLFFVANAVQPVMAHSIQKEGGSAFGFLVVGVAILVLVSAAITTLPLTVSQRVNSGVLEALLTTPVSTTQLLLGLNALDVVLAATRALVLLGAGAALGAALLPSRALAGLAISALIFAAHLPLGLIGAALVIAFRTAGPLPKGLLMISSLLGGVYYPTSVVPSWLRDVSAFLPLTYGLRALRRVVLQDAPLATVLPDLAALVGAGAVLFAISALAVSAALRRARREGTLAQY